MGQQSSALARGGGALLRYPGSTGLLSRRAVLKQARSSTGSVTGTTGASVYKAPVTPVMPPWMIDTGLPAQPKLPIAGDSVKPIEEHRVSVAVLSKSSNAPRIVGADSVKMMVPYQKSVWSVKAEDVVRPEDGLAEAPQSELMKTFARDQLAPLQSVDVFAMEEEKERERYRSGPTRSLLLQLKRARFGSRDAEGLWVRDESYWEWHVKDKYGFLRKPKHLTWEQFEEELRTFGLFWELHPTKPEDYIILHLIKGEGENRKVIWSAEHAAWETPVFMDMWAAIGTMLARRLKTRTLSFDNGRGTIKELNIRHLGPWTSAVQISGRPAYYYDPLLREERESNAGWYFSKEVMALPGQDDEGTVSHYISAQALAYHLCIAVSGLLHRPMWSFFRRGRRRSAEHRAGKRQRAGKTGVLEAVQGWTGYDTLDTHLWPAPNQLDALTDHWLEDSPYPLVSVWDNVRKLAGLRHVNLDLKSFVCQNTRLTQDAVRGMLQKHAPQLLLAASEPVEDEKALSSTERLARWSLSEQTATQLYKAQRAKIYVPPPDASTFLEGAAEPEAKADVEDELAQKGRQRQKEREAQEGSQRDSEAWEWLAAGELEGEFPRPAPEIDVVSAEDGRLASAGAVKLKTSVAAEG